MSIQPDSDLLTTLRENLRHFENCGDNELGPDAVEIKQMIRRPIAIIEDAMENIKKITSQEGSNRR